MKSTFEHSMNTPSPARAFAGINRKCAVVALLFSALGGLTLAHAGESVTERNREFIAQAFEEWAGGGKTFFADVLAPDVSWTIKGTSPAAGTYKGREEFMKRAVAPFVARLSSPIRPTVNHIWADGDHVIVYWDGEGTAADGKPYRNSYVWIFRMEDLRATEVIAFLDLVPFDDVIRRIPLDSQARRDESAGFATTGASR